LFVHLLESIGEDIRFAFRMMRRSRGLTAVSVLSLALGIGATIAIFSVIYALALRQSGKSFESGKVFFRMFSLITTSMCISKSRTKQYSKR